MGAAAVGLAVASGVFGAVSSIQESKEQSKQLKAQANLQAEQVIDEGFQLQQQQKSIATGGGYVLDNDTSPLLVMMETERESKRQAKQIRDTGYTESKSIRRAGNLKAFGSLLGAGASIAGMKK